MRYFPLRTVSIVAAIATSAGVVTSAAAQTVSGWDFSQWQGSDLLSVNGMALTNVLSANYSSLDPTNNAGAESAAFGTAFFNGQFGSTSVDPQPGAAIFVPVGGSLVANLDGPALDLEGNPIPGANPFDSLEVLDSEGQRFRNRLSMGATAPVSVVFSGDLSGVPQSGSNWSLVLGARADSDSALGVDFSTDGVSYATVTSLNLAAGDTRYQVNLSAATAERAFVRLRFQPPSGGAQFIDNVVLQALVGAGGDTDGDGIPDASDNCPFFASANQTDTDSDGRGNQCECTDQNGDGQNTVSDLVAINTAIFNPGQVTPLCDGNNDRNCNVNDLIAANVEIFSPTSTSTCARQPVPGP
jgi:hypothetical protein